MGSNPYRQGLGTPVATPTRTPLPGQAPVPWTVVGGGGTTDPRGTPLVDTSGGGDPFATQPNAPAGSPPGTLPGTVGQPPAATQAPTTPAEIQREIMRMRAMESVDGMPYGAVDPVEFYIPQGMNRGSFNATSSVVLGLRDQDKANPNGFYDYDFDGNEVPANLTAVDLVGGGSGHVVQATNPTPDVIESAVPG